MAAALVEGFKVSTAGASTLDGTFTTPPSAGHAVVVCSGAFNSTTYQTAADNRGNTYTPRASALNSDWRYRILTAHNVATGTPFTVTLTNAAPDAMSMVISGWSGVTATPFDIGTTNTGTGTAASISSGALAQAEEVVVAMVGHGGAETTQVALNVPPWVQTGEESNHNNIDNNTIHQVVNSTSAVTASWTEGTSINWVACVVSLKATSSAPLGSSGLMAPQQRMG